MVINIAKREIEKERELLMSKSLVGNEDNIENDESDSGSDTESDDKCKLCLFLYFQFEIL